jgi:hypothetical protein
MAIECGDKNHTIAHGEKDKENAPANSQKRKRSPTPKLQYLDVGGLTPILFQALKVLTDQFNGGTDGIVNVDGFVAECRRILEVVRGRALGGNDRQCRPFDGLHPC